MSRLDAKQIKKIIEVYSETNSIEKTKEITGHSSNTISNYVGNISRRKIYNQNCSNEVCQIDKNTNEVIKVWFKPSIAAKELGINPSCISRALKNDLKTAGGFIWKYKE